MIKSIIFDLDGTLLNTLEDLRDSVNYVLTRHSMPTRTLEEIRSFVGNGIPMLIKRAVPKGTSPEETARATEEMIDYYKSHNMIKTAPYEDIPELLAELRSRGIACAVVTNKNEAAARELCAVIFGNSFEAVIGDNGKDALKPNPDSVFRAMAALNTTRQEALYVGDSEVDMQTAKNSGLPGVGVLWGFRDRDVLETNGADYIISSPNQLLDLIK